MRWRRPFQERGKIRFKHHLVSDDGVVFVLIAGLGAEYEIFSLVADALAVAGQNYILVEPPGFGYCDPKAASYTLQEAAELILDSPEVLRGRRLVYVGHSAGFMVAAELAATDRRAIGLVSVNGLLDGLAEVLNNPRQAWRHPIKSLCLAGLLVYMCGWLPRFVQRILKKPGHPLTLMFWPLVARPRKLSKQALEALVDHNRCPSARAHLLFNRRYKYQCQAEALNVPLTVIYGQRDPLATPPEESDFLRKYCERHTANIVPSDTAHCTPVEAPHDVVVQLLRFAA